MLRRRSKPDKPKPRGSRRYSRTPLTTYYRSDSEPKQTASPFKRRQPKKNRRGLVFGIVDIVLVALLLAGLFYSLLLSSAPKVSVTDLSYRDLNTYSLAANQAFSSLKNRNKISFDEAAVVAKLQRQFPEISTASVELPFFSQTAKLRLVISKPVFRLTSANQNFVVDSQGTAVAKLDDLPKLGPLVTVNDQTGYRTSVGQQILSSTEVNFVNQLIKQAQAAKIPITSLTLPPLAQEIDLRTADQPYYVKFYIGGDPQIQTGQFLAARQSFASSAQQPSQYLDVRVPGKIFYK